jgi:hypothetical protein
MPLRHAVSSFLNMFIRRLGDICRTAVPGQVAPMLPRYHHRPHRYCALAASDSSNKNHPVSNVLPILPALHAD